MWAVEWRLPTIPESVRGWPCCAVGWVARQVLGGRRVRLPPRLLVAAEVSALRASWPALEPDPCHPGWLRAGSTWSLERWLVQAAPDGLEAALAARRLPLDALGVTPSGELLDPLQAESGWRSGRLLGGIRADSALFEANPTLLLRIPALASALGLPLAPRLVDALREHASLVLKADRRDARAALDLLLLGRQPASALEVLGRTSLLGFVLPEVASLIDFHRSSRYHHKDIWHHTRRVVAQALPRFELRWTALLHDVGKVHTRSYSPGRKVHFLRHEALGAYMFEGIEARLGFPPGPSQRIHALIARHLRANLYDASWSDAAVRRLATDLGPIIDDLIHFSRADVTSRRPGRRREAIANLYALRQRIEALAATDQARRWQIPKGLGRAIIDELGVTPGPRVGALRSLCEAALRAGDLPAQPSISTCVAFLRRIDGERRAPNPPRSP